jgi:hypothetical protein
MNNKLARNFKPFDIETKEVKDRISRNQQCYVFGIVYPRLRQGLVDCGYELNNITDEQFDYFMREMFYFDVVQTSKGEKRIPRRLSFSKANKKEVTKYINELLMFASKVGVYIPSQQEI